MKKINLLKHRILLILLLVILIINILGIKCFAADEIYNSLPEGFFETIKPNMPELGDIDYHCFIWYHRSMGYSAWFFYNCSEDFKISLNTSVCKWYITGSSSIKQYMFDTSGVLTSSTTRYITNGAWDASHSAWDEYHNNYLYLQNITVHTISGDIFFQGLPLLMTGKIMEVDQILTIITQTMKLIIPIGLAIFGILLVISLIKLVILRMT